MKYKKDYLPYLAGIIVSIIFGFSFLFTKSSLDIMAPMQILAYRFSVAAIVLSVLRITGFLKISFKGRGFGKLLVLAFIQPIAYFIFETLGVQLTSSSEAGMMIALIPVVVTIFAAIFLKEKTSLKQAVFIIFSVFGVIFIMLAGRTSGTAANYRGLLILMGAVLSAGTFNTLSRKLSVQFKPVEITYVMMCTGALIFNVLAVIEQALDGSIGSYFTPLFNINSWVPVLYLGILSSVVAFFMTNFMLSRLPASQSSVFSNLTTIISILGGVLIRHESFRWFQGVGGFMILLGVWGTNYFAARSPAAKADSTCIKGA